MANSISNIYTENRSNRRTTVNVIVGGWVVACRLLFAKHSVEIIDMKAGYKCSGVYTTM